MDQEYMLTFGPFRLETSSGRLWREDDAIPLRPRSFAMLQYLAERPGRLVTKAEVIQQVWEGSHVSDGVLRASVRDIRRALGDVATAPQYLETVGRQGYRFLQGGDPLSLQTSGPVVGRQQVVDQLQDRFGRAAGGERQFVLLSGEPGIGKTTVVNLFLERMTQRDSVRVAQGQCVVHYGEGEAYQPLLEALGRLVQEPGGAEVLSVLQRNAPMWLVQLPALVSGVELERLQRQVQGATQARMVRELCSTLEVLTAETPLILVLEDLHWSDVSTVELLAAIAQHSAPARLFVLATYRPADAAVHAQALRAVIQELQGRGQCDEWAMEFLSPEDVASYVTGRLAGSVSGRLSRLVSRRSEGNPLFMVNLIDHLAQQGDLVQEAGEWTVPESVQSPGSTVPEGLRPLITRRLEALSPEERSVLEVASVAGMTYTTAAVAAGLQQELEDIEERVESLATQGLFITASGLVRWPDGTLSGRYRFQHALYHQVLYEQVGAARRAQLHLRLGERLELSYGEQVHEIATELAIHFEQSRDAGRAVQYRQLAGEQSLARHAYREATEHLSRGLDWLKDTPETPDRIQQELALLTALGPALVAIRGYAAPEVEQSYARARRLCQGLGETPQLFPVLWGLGHFYLQRAELSTVLEIGRQLLAMTQPGSPDRNHLVMAHLMLGTPLYWLGELSEARHHLEAALDLYDSQEYDPSAPFSGDDPGIACRVYHARVLWMLGYPDQALASIRKALALAEKLEHPFSLAYAQSGAAFIHQLRREAALTQRWAEAALGICTEHAFPFVLAWSKILRGTALSEQGYGEDGIAEIRNGLDQHHGLEATLGRPHLLSLLAQAYGNAQRPADGLPVLLEAQSAADQSGERVCQAERHRLQGKLLLQHHHILSPQSEVSHPQSLASAPQEEVEAETCFLMAIEVARLRHAKALELRAAICLSRLWQKQGKRTEALALLAPVYDAFTEGFDTADLQEAQELLVELAE